MGNSGDLLGGRQATVVFCDGAAKGNPGPGGWGVVVATADGHVVELGGGAPHTTNNRMELTAAIRGLERVASRLDAVAVYTDSTYVIKGISEWIWGWRRRGWKTAEGNDVLNRELWQDLDLPRQQPRQRRHRLALRPRPHRHSRQRTRRRDRGRPGPRPANRALRRPARPLSAPDLRPAGRYVAARPPRIVGGAAAEDGRALLPQPGRRHRDAPLDVGRLRAARQGPLGRALQEGGERRRRAGDSARLARRSRQRVSTPARDFQPRANFRAPAPV